MENCELLYVKGMNLSETEDDNAEEYVDIWDDRKLNDAYDKALKIANAEVAKRVAMSTNTHQKVQSKIKKETSPKQASTKDSQQKAIQWKVGMTCRARYDEDGQEYEAHILRLINDKECVVKFIGYNNSELVSIGSLKKSSGKQARMEQLQQALCDKVDDGFASQSPQDNMECSDAAVSVASAEGSSHRKKKSQKKKRNQRVTNLPEIPPLNATLIGNLGSMHDMPLAPPPPIGFDIDLPGSEDQALSSMLLSWYMSGYYTGLYQGMKRVKEHLKK